MKLTIVILSQHRRDLLEATIHSLLATLTIRDFELVVYNHSGSIGEGWNYFVDWIDSEYVLICQDDWYFIEQWDWVDKAIKALQSEKAGIVRLRKNQDGQNEEKIINEYPDYVEVECVTSGFSLNPFIAKTSLIKELGKVKNTDRLKGVAEIELREKYANNNFRTFKLANPAHGVCIHIGRGRRILGIES